MNANLIKLNQTVAIIVNYYNFETEIFYCAVINGTPMYSIDQRSGDTGWITLADGNIECAIGDEQQLTDMLTDNPTVKGYTVLTNESIEDIQTKALEFGY